MHVFGKRKAFFVAQVPITPTARIEVAMSLDTQPHGKRQQGQTATNMQVVPAQPPSNRQTTTKLAPPTPRM